MDTQEPPTAIAVAVVRQADSVLIGLRPQGKPLAGCWEFPGGKIGSGESPGDAAVRECYEETGLRIQVSRSMAVVDHRYEHETVRLHFVEAVAAETESRPRLPFRWVPIAELGEYRFPPANAGVLQALKAGRIC
ncbi:MAG: (deoxy)nucleoside triphosphate pyrophosphohydrolase [Planctomycetaceae bacterium]|nr:(deoxy)nucleoside triphosphate pyrophosphohydrolase [Planctomycetaceae bacterium]